MQRLPGPFLRGLRDLPSSLRPGRQPRHPRVQRNARVPPPGPGDRGGRRGDGRLCGTHLRRRPRPSGGSAVGLPALRGGQGLPHQRRHARLRDARRGVRSGRPGRDRGQWLRHHRHRLPSRQHHRLDRLPPAGRGVWDPPGGRPESGNHQSGAVCGTGSRDWLPCLRKTGGYSCA